MSRTEQGVDGASTYINLRNQELCEFVSEDAGVVTFKRLRAGKLAYLGRAEFDKRFQPQQVSA